MRIDNLPERQQFIDNILENAPVIIWSIDLEGRFTYTHGKGLENIGSKPGENIGRSVFDVYRGTGAATFIKQVLDGEKMAEIVKIGNFFYDTRVSALTNQNGEKYGYMGVSLDVTDHLKDQSDLKKFRQALDQVPSAVYIIDKNMQFEYINPGFTNQSGYTEEDLLHKHVNATIYKGEIPESRRHVVDTLGRGESWEGELLSRHKTGRMYWATTVAAPYKDESGNVEGYLVLQQDISRLKQLEAELKAAKEELELLNHDLENRIIESSQKLTEANTQLFRVQKENLQSQFEVLRQQVNPHFLFNSLNVLTSLIKLEPDLAEKFTEHLSKVYRYVLENKDNDLVSLATELDFLDAYLFLLNIRFVDKIKVEINISVDKNGYLILPLALQLIIENVIKHNSMSKKNPLTIKIFVDEQLNLNIINNLQERESHMVSTGVGLKNIAHRYELLELPAPQFYKTETQFVAKIPLQAKE